MTTESLAHAAERIANDPRLPDELTSALCDWLHCLAMGAPCYAGCGEAAARAVMDHLDELSSSIARMRGLECSNAPGPYAEACSGIIEAYRLAGGVA